METHLRTRNDFSQRYWTYYLILEKNFLETEQFLAIDELNYTAFSNEYIKQYQTICSEIDVIAKSYCREIDSTFKGRHINTYCKCILDNNPDFTTQVIKLTDKNLLVTPWKDWAYSMVVNSKGKSNPESINPDWWQKYNRIKHARTTINTETGLPYYKLANQKNVLNSLAALFQLEMYYYRLLHQKYFSSDPDMPGPPSEFFSIENWGNTWVMAGPNIGFQIVNR